MIYLGRTKGQYIPTYFYKPFSALSLSKNFGQLLLKPYMSSWFGKILKFKLSRLPENTFTTQKIENRNFCSSSQAKLSPRFILSPPPPPPHPPCPTHTHTHTHTTPTRAHTHTQKSSPPSSRKGGRVKYLDLQTLVKCSPTRAYCSHRPKPKLQKHQNCTLLSGVSSSISPIFTNICPF